MSRASIWIAAVLSLGWFGVACQKECPEGFLLDNNGNCIEVPSWDDDDAADDDAADDDDDDATPEYTGEIDMSGAQLSGECDIDVPSEPGTLGEGTYHFDIELSGWALDCYINFRDHVSDYCEAYDSVAGDPCDSFGFVRGGWDMVNDDHGWDAVDGFWDSWVVEVDYLMDLMAAEAQGLSIFVCENAGLNFDTEFCCRDLYTESVFCEEYDW